MWSYIKQALSSNPSASLVELLNQLEAREKQDNENAETSEHKDKLISIFLEAERLKNERLQLWFNFFRFILGTLIIGGISLGINWQVQMFQLKQEREAREAEYLARFIEEALDVNLDKRLRFAHYFKSLTLSEDVQDRWETYYRELRVQALGGSERLAVLKAQREAYGDSLPLTEEAKHERNLLEAEIAQLEEDIPDNFLLVLDSWSEESLDDPITRGVDFTWADATHGGTRIPQSLEIRANIARMAIELQKAQDQLGERILVTSWYRTAEINQAVGGVPNSPHITGSAVAIIVEGYTPEQLMEELKWWPGTMKKHPIADEVLQLTLETDPQ